MSFLDIECDSDLDVIVVNGAVKRTFARSTRESNGKVSSALDPNWHPYAERNQILLSQVGEDSEFALMEGDEFTSIAAVSRGLAVGDIDGDGGLDLLVNNLAEFLSNNPYEFISPKFF